MLAAFVAVVFQESVRNTQHSLPYPWAFGALLTFYLSIRLAVLFCHGPCVAKFDRSSLSSNPFHLLQAHYAILSDEDIEARQAEAVKSVASVLSVTEEEATILLRHFKW